MIAAEARTDGGIGTEGGERAGFRIEAIEAAPVRSHPERAIAVFQDVEDALAAEAAGDVGVGKKPVEGVGIRGEAIETPSIRPDPQDVVAVLVDDGYGIVAQARRIVGVVTEVHERVRTPGQTVQATRHRADPERLLAIDEERHHPIVTEASGGMEIVPVAAHRVRLPIHPVQSAVRPDPDRTIWTLGEARDDVVDESFFASRRMAVQREGTHVRVPSVGPRVRAYPEHASSVLIERENAVFAQTPRVGWIVLVTMKLPTGKQLVESRIRAEP